MKELTVTYRGYGHALELGTLASDGKDMLFQYSLTTLQQGLELSPVRLPLRRGAYPDRQADYVVLQGVPGLLYDSLPDSWGYRLIHRRLKARGTNPNVFSALDYLAYLGENTMGALTYAPTTHNLTESHDLTLMELAAEVQALEVDEGHQVLAELVRVGGSPGGARPKALVYFNPRTSQLSTRPAKVLEGEPWLVKFPASDDEPDSCALEELYARLARSCDLGMMATFLFDLPGRLPAFGTQRFDRQYGERVHVHTLAGLLHANFQEPSLSYEDFFRVTRRLTRDQRELKKAVQRCAFNVLVNNRDDHAKNISFLLDRDGAWRLAPPYDLTYCPGYHGEHFMDIAGEGKAPTRADLIKSAKAGGLSAAETTAILDELLARVTPLLVRQLASQLPIRTSTVELVVKAVAGNHARLSKA